jgi:hypothetical protein
MIRSDITGAILIQTKLPVTDDLFEVFQSLVDAFSAAEEMLLFEQVCTKAMLEMDRIRNRGCL